MKAVAIPCLPWRSNLANRIEPKPSVAENPESRAKHIDQEEAQGPEGRAPTPSPNFQTQNNRIMPKRISRFRELGRRADPVKKMVKSRDRPGDQDPVNHRRLV
jgi:hypothetical protein